MRYRVKVSYCCDENDNPRNCDNAGKMICWHRRYHLGDKHDYCDSEHAMLSLIAEKNPSFEEDLEVWASEENNKVDWQSPEAGRHYSATDKERDTRIENEFERHYIALPLWLYDHSGISISTGRRCSWDSGRVGFIYAEIGTSENTLSDEIETYNDFIQGNVFHYTIEQQLEMSDVPEAEHSGEYDPETFEWAEVDSCGGFYGDDAEKNGMQEESGVPLAVLKTAMYDLDTWVGYKL